MRKQVRLHFVYMIFYPGTQIACYVGQGTGRRDTRHWAQAKNEGLKALIKEHGKLQVVRVSEKLTQHEAWELEMRIIADIGRTHLGTGSLLNRSEGGRRPRMSAEAREKIAASKRGKKRSPETIAKLSAWRTGRKLSDETRAKMSASHKGLKNTPEQCAAISAAKKGKQRPPKFVAASDSGS